jgi:aspartate carbamoyltransferase catalytic subunit
MNWPHKDLIGIQGLSSEEISQILEMASSFKEISKRERKKVPTFGAKRWFYCFMNPAHDLLSFEIAAKL